MTIWKSCVTPASDPLRPALFLDRDGVVITDRDYLRDPDELELIAGAAAAMKSAAAAGYLLVGVSNQSGLGRGLFTRRDLELVMTRLDEMLAAEGTAFDGFYFCPHAPVDRCGCRKPETGLLEEAANTCRWDPSRSWVVGDKVSDVLLARTAGLGSVLVLTGHGAEHEDEVRSLAEKSSRILVAADLPAAFAALRGAEREDRDP